ncbi:AP2-like ethylene-responsive transcription factor CRL5 isoform X2 [Hordeum vulgare subsp. vulgare]|uniref:AP2-like ethylene-responsive transcription factor CRL5 isoform X2 n=1 Tax=Hordeum vulgare subsp. vulgare TaxID=112509 RepID=UPI001D1A4E72|nr:AP2-like ethylene-responsive transcription factor CRL5 isoform X2 [Hordeum vulgare subsp. vulgare]
MTNGGHSMSGAGGWLGFSLSPQVAAAAMDAAAGSGIVDVAGHHHAHHGGVYYHPDPVASSPMSFYFGGGDNVGAASGGYYSGISALPLRSDGSLCLADALRRSEQKHHGAEVSAPPKLEDFLGAGPAMALSLDNSGYYYGGHSHDNDGAGGGQQPLLYAMMPGSGGHHMYYDAHAALLDEQAAATSAAMEAAGWMARDGDVYDVDAGNGEEGGGAIVPAGPGNPGGYAHPLTLSISSGSQSSCVTVQQAAAQAHAYVGQATAASKKRGAGAGAKQNKQPVVHRKCIDTFGQRTSKYRGVTSRHRWTGRYEAHLWDNSCRKEGQTRKGRQVYLGGYDMEEKAGRAYDLAALKYWGASTHINFPVEDYQEELEVMKNMTRLEYVAHIRRKSSGFSRGASMYRGVTRHHQQGRWQARIGRVSGNKDLYLGTFSAEADAAEAYDVAAIKFRGVSAVTNFEISRYDVDKIMESSTLLPADQVRRRKDGPDALVASAAAALVQAGGAADYWRQPVAAASAVTPCGDKQSRHHLDLMSSESLSLLRGVVSMDGDAAGAHGMGNSSSARMSGASSLATSLSNSREQSPDQGGGLAMLFARPAVPKLASSLPMGSWVSSPTPARPGVSVAHMSVFAAWADA